MEKTKINARIVADSINPQGNRITTFVLTYPRIIHAEVMTHRLFSRNAASSRAIPFKKMVKSVMDDPFIPIAWQKDHKGMQGVGYFEDESYIHALKERWKDASMSAIKHAKRFNKGLTRGIPIPGMRDFTIEDIPETSVTKQLCNRLLEPFQWYTCLVTVTELENFYELRCPKYKIYSENMPMYFRSRKDLNKYVEAVGDTPFELTEEDWWMQSESGAEIHIQALAEAMWDAQNESTPNQLQAGQWYIPFGDKMDDNILHELAFAQRGAIDGLYEDIKIGYRIKIATARAARLSYMTFDGAIDYEKDIALHDTLLASRHMSPFEHCARAMNDDEYVSFVKGKLDTIEIDDPNPGDFVAYNKVWNHDKEAGWCNNFKGFIQYRYLVENGK